MRFIAALAVVLVTAASVPVAHAAPPANKSACLDKAFALAEAGAKKKLETDKAQQLEAMLTKLEAKCAANDLTGAEADISAVDAMLKAK